MSTCMNISKILNIRSPWCRDYLIHRNFLTVKTTASVILSGAQKIVNETSWTSSFNFGECFLTLLNELGKKSFFLFREQRHHKRNEQQTDKDTPIANKAG